MRDNLHKTDAALRYRRFQQILRADPILARKVASDLVPGTTVFPAVVGRDGMTPMMLHSVLEHETMHLDAQADLGLTFSADWRDRGPAADRVRDPLSASLVPRHSAALASIMFERSHA